MDLDEVLGRHFAPQARAGDPDIDPALVDRLLRMLGVEAAQLGLDARTWLLALSGAIATGLDEDALLAVAQAYGRAIGRIVDAESEIVRRRIRDRPAEERAEALDTFLHGSRPIAERLFLTVHAARLHAALRQALDEQG